MEFSSKFFENRQCKFFPCHNLQGDFNCLFCYCPLYTREVCPGNPSFIKKENGTLVKRCTDCTFPHKPENYERIMNLLRAARNEIDFTEYHHGGEIFSDIKYDFSVNTNPLGLSETVKNALQSSFLEFERYPDQNCTLLRENLSEREGIQKKNIVFGNGASELISLAVHAIMPKSALIIEPAFYGYEKALKICYSKINRHVLTEEDDFILGEDIFDSIRNVKPDMIFLCTPDNPTGRMADFSILKKLIEYCEKSEIFLFVDECFIDFTEKKGESALRFIDKNPHLIVLNAFTKIYAMAGLRLGYIVTSNESLLQKINFIKPEWNVSKAAQTAGIAALSDSNSGYLSETRNLIKKEREYLSENLKKSGFKVFKSDANFVLFKDIYCKTQKLDDFLLQRDILIRNCSNFTGLTDKFYRIAVRNHEENEKLIDHLKNYKN
ncbi:aminotransferase class I/II-fold pyridoxal phosphate-dependent enzyme [Treponema sp.]|uniref:aminotransferase class I/II-fold pyridoxal phosphate-dependent enzyme n=1 Tax=Treponema sp. TaxID=166 RepID=UPI003890E08F